jgi:hypothetical protein
VNDEGLPIDPGQSVVVVVAGGDRVVLDGEFNKEYAAWKEEMPTGNPSKMS